MATIPIGKKTRTIPPKKRRRRRRGFRQKGISSSKRQTDGGHRANHKKLETNN